MTAIERQREMLAKATPPPWRWFGQIGQSIYLATVDRGVLTVMDTQRKGMQGAELVFFRPDPERTWGWNGKRETATEVAVREVPYRTDVVDLDTPNAALLVQAVNDRAALLDVVQAAEDVWASVPATNGEDDPMVRRHARTLNALRAALDWLHEQEGWQP